MYVLHNGHPFLLVTGASVLFTVLLLTILKYIGRQNLSVYLAFPYFLIAAIATSLVYTNSLPENLSGP